MSFPLSFFLIEIKRWKIKTFFGQVKNFSVNSSSYSIFSTLNIYISNSENIFYKQFTKTRNRNSLSSLQYFLISYLYANILIAYYESIYLSLKKKKTSLTTLDTSLLPDLCKNPLKPIARIDRDIFQRSITLLSGER